MRERREDESEVRGERGGVGGTAKFCASNLWSRQNEHTVSGCGFLQDQQSVSFTM